MDLSAVPLLKELAAAGHRLILWTMRDGEYLTAAERWFAARGIPLWGVNANPEQKGWSESPKCYAHLYIDDCAVGVPLCPGKQPGDRPYVDWSKLRALLLDRIHSQ